jgi:hypothetical protein
MSVLVRANRLGSMAGRAWIIFLVFGALTVLAAPINLLGHPPNPPSPERSTGLTAETIEARVPGMAEYIGSISRQMGNFMLAFGVLLMGVAAGPFRRGERWAWYVSWSVPLLLLIQLLNSRGGLGCNSISAASL